MDEWLERASKNGSLTTDERLTFWKVAALNRIAEAIERQAEATLVLARATAGEFDDEGESIGPAENLPAGFRGMR